MSTSVESKGSSCPVCLERFDAEKKVPIVFSCGHGACIGCNQNLEKNLENCPTCKKPIMTRAKNFAFVETLKMMVDVHKRIDELKDPKINYQCSNCQKWTLGKNMHICKTCILDKDVLDMTNIAEGERAKKVVEVSMCSNCVVPKHSYWGHTLVAMFPTWNYWNFPSYLPMIEENWETVKYSLYMLEPTFLHFKRMSNEVFETRNLMLGMARRSKCIEDHSEIIDKMEKFIDEVISIYSGTEEEMRRRTDTFQASSCISPPDSPTIESKFNEFKNACNSLKQTYSQQSEIIAKSFTKFIDLARNSETAVKRDDILEKIDEFVDETSENYEGVRLMLEERTVMVQKSLKQVNDWCKTESVAFTGESKSIERKSSTESEDDADSEYLVMSFKDFYI